MKKLPNGVSILPPQPPKHVSVKREFPPELLPIRMHGDTPIFIYNELLEYHTKNKEYYEYDIYYLAVYQGEGGFDITEQLAFYTAFLDNEKVFPKIDPKDLPTNRRIQYPEFNNDILLPSIYPPPLQSSHQLMEPIITLDYDRVLPRKVEPDETLYLGCLECGEFYYHTYYYTKDDTEGKINALRAREFLIANDEKNILPLLCVKEVLNYVL